MQSAITGGRIGDFIRSRISKGPSGLTASIEARMRSTTPPPGERQQQALVVYDPAGGVAHVGHGVDGAPGAQHLAVGLDRGAEVRRRQEVRRGICRRHRSGRTPRRAAIHETSSGSASRRSRRQLPSRPGCRTERGCRRHPAAPDRKWFGAASRRPIIEQPTLMVRPDDVRPGLHEFHPLAPPFPRRRGFANDRRLMSTAFARIPAMRRVS